MYTAAPKINIPSSATLGSTALIDVEYRFPRIVEKSEIRMGEDVQSSTATGAKKQEKGIG